MTCSWLLPGFNVKLESLNRGRVNWMGFLIVECRRRSWQIICRSHRDDQFHPYFSTSRMVYSGLENIRERLHHLHQGRNSYHLAWHPVSICCNFAFHEMPKFAGGTAFADAYATIPSGEGAGNIWQSEMLQVHQSESVVLSVRHQTSKRDCAVDVGLCWSVPACWPPLGRSHWHHWHQMVMLLWLLLFLCWNLVYFVLTCFNYF